MCLHTVAIVRERLSMLLLLHTRDDFGSNQDNSSKRLHRRERRMFLSPTTSAKVETIGSTRA